MQNDETAGFRGDPRLAEYPGTYIRDWIMLCRDVPDSAFRAYCIVRAHIWEKDVERTVTLTQFQIAEMIDKSEERTRKILKPLIAVGLLSIAQKRQWWEYNPATKRQERRTMNVYAVTDFPPEGYLGARSLKDFGLRFAGGQEVSSGTDRSETTGREAAGVSAGQTDGSETTGGESSQLSNVYAGQTDRLKTASAVVKNDRPYKNLFQEGEGEEWGARGGARREPDPDPDEPPLRLGARGGGAVPTQADADIIAAAILAGMGKNEGISQDDHYELALMAHTAVEAMAPAGVERADLQAWLCSGLRHPDGRRAYRDNLVGVLKHRLTPGIYGPKYRAWRAQLDQNNPANGPQGGREAVPELEGPGPKADAAPCGVHRTQLTADHHCLQCEAETAAQDAAHAETLGHPIARDRLQDTADDDQDEDAEGPVDEAVLDRMRTDLTGGHGDHHDNGDPRPIRGRVPGARAAWNALNTHEHTATGS